MQTTQMEKILRHRAPMIFLDEVIASGDDHLQASIRIRPGIPFFEANIGVPGWVGIEYMAQSIAALAGVRATAAGTEVPLGMLIGCRQFSCTVAAFEPGLNLMILVRQLAAEDYGFGSFDCEIRSADDDGASPGEPMAQARVSVFGGNRQDQV